MCTPTPGVYRVPFREYTSWKALNWSTLKHYAKSAKHGRHASLHPADSTDALRFGDAVHAAILEPDRFKVEYVTMPDFDGHHNSNKYRDAKKQWQHDYRDKVHLSGEEYLSLLAMSASAQAHPIVSQLVSGFKGRNEISILWNSDGIDRKARIDRLTQIPFGILNPASPVAGTNVLCVIDVKTTKDASPEAFSRDVARYGYHGQAAWYGEGLAAVQPANFIHVIIAIEKEPPYDCVPYLLSDETIEQGQNLTKRLLQLKRKCEESKNWPGIAEDAAIPLHLPRWAMEVADVS